MNFFVILDHFHNYIQYVHALPFTRQLWGLIRSRGKIQAHVVEKRGFFLIFSVSSETSIVTALCYSVGGSLSETRLYTILTFFFVPSLLRTHHTMENLMDSVQKRIFNLLESGAL